MINVTFSDSLTGSLKMADYYAKRYDSEIKDLKENIFSLILGLDLGDISELEPGEKRVKDFVKLYGEEDNLLRTEWFYEQLDRIEKIKELLRKGHEIRIWYSENAREFCGFCWLLTILDLWGIENDRILFEKLPNSIIHYNGEFETFGSSGMFDPEFLQLWACEQRYLTESYKKYHINQWKRAMAENKGMRITLNEQILSVNVDFYDSVILSEIEKLDDVFREAEAVGQIIAKLYTTDAFIVQRIDTMIEQGRFEIVEEAKNNQPNYFRLLRKLNYKE